LRENGCHVSAIFVTTLDDLAIINLVVSPERMVGRRGARSSPAGLVLAKMFAPQMDPADERITLLDDYRTLVTPVLRVASPKESLAAIWLAWSTPARPGALEVAVHTARSSFDIVGRRYGPTIGQASFDYLVCRAVSVDRLHGRSKVAVDLKPVVRGLDDDVIPGALGNFCSEIERQWRNEISFVLGTAGVDLEVVWRESWIGHSGALHGARMRPAGT
jgi:hypothetical protein